ncbi:MAG: CPBP family intramembrane glutamic endopeptidase [Acholeplasmataceae bacterium]|jgi:membrane protease YdiL (CAAX protease family)|nr:CPBP family intramembrane glutamic endopeptidase [Acholeplasmataceae bacterium]
MDNNNKEIIDFEDLFKKEIEERKEQRDPHRKKRYGYTLLTYLLVMNVLVAIFYFIFLSIPALTVTYTEDHLVLYELAITENGFVVMDDNTYLEYDHLYLDYIVNIGNYNNYTVLINKNNDAYEDLLVIADVLDENVLVSILNGTTSTWLNEQDIILIAGKDQVLPLVFTADFTAIDGPEKDLSTTSFSFLNFLVYMTMLPVIILLLKRDIYNDFAVAKKWRTEWVSIIFIGYLYLIIGNFGSNVISELLANLFGVITGDSVNQMSIQNSLNSNGAIFMILSAVILGPIVEELVFRKAMFGLFKNDYVGLVVSSLTFGAIHLLGESSIQMALVNGTVYFVMGFIFGYIYLKNHKNLYAPLAVHILSNLLSIILILSGLGG